MYIVGLGEAIAVGVRKGTEILFGRREELFILRPTRRILSSLLYKVSAERKAATNVHAHLRTPPQARTSASPIAVMEATEKARKLSSTPVAS